MMIQWKLGEYLLWQVFNGKAIIASQYLVIEDKITIAN